MRVGIVTMFHNNLNYGGNLQAWALQQVCQNMGYDTELLDFNAHSRIQYPFTLARKYLIRLKTELIHTGNKEYYRIRNERERAVARFNRRIPHSILYFSETIVHANTKYDCFIVGSDQVWNPMWLNRAYTLEFAEESKFCFSYAASMGVSELDQKQKEVFQALLRRMNAISVREEKSIDLLRELTEKDIDCVLDPTLLIAEEQWHQLCVQRLVHEKYVFCFFFGEQDKPRTIAEKYAKNHGLKIVTIPFLSNTYRKIDDAFGDIRLSGVSPEQFLTLIRDAEYVFTDSFHATVFAHLLKKQFITYAENANKTRVRMLSLTKLFGTENRFLGDEQETDIDYIEHLPAIQYDDEPNEFHSMKERSLGYLRETLKRAEKYERNNR